MPSETPSTAPSTAAPSTQSPTKVPTQVPSLSPSEPLSAAGRFIRSIVQPATLQGGAEWNNPDNYQAKAIAWLESDQYTLTLSNARIRQRYSLACIFLATNAVKTKYTVVEPREWIEQRGWLTDTDECDWFGLSCNGNREIDKINLASNRLTGSFPPETAILASSLTRLDLFRNSVYNTGDAGHAWLGLMREMRALYYGQTNFEYNGIPPQIAQLTNLVEYDCSYTLYFGPLVGSTFAPLENLEYLVLSGNAYNTSVPAEIGNLPKLHFFYAQNAFVDGDLSFMEGMRSILDCWVDQNPGLGGTIPTFIGNLQTMQSLSLTRSGFRGTIPTEMGNLRNLVRLWLYDNLLTGTVPTELGNLFKLQVLEIEENLLTGTMPFDLCLNRVPLGLLQNLEADCAGAIECDCCTCCANCLPVQVA